VLTYPLTKEEEHYYFGTSEVIPAPLEGVTHREREREREREIKHQLLHAAVCGGGGRELPVTAGGRFTPLHHFLCGEPACQPISESANQPASQAISQSVSQSANQLAGPISNQPASQLVSQSVGQRISNQPANHQ